MEEVQCGASLVAARDDHCYGLRSVFHLSEEMFRALNPTLSCPTPGKGARVCVSPKKPKVPASGEPPAVEQSNMFSGYVRPCSQHQQECLVIGSRELGFRV